jgi:hypothetical protein
MDQMSHVAMMGMVKMTATTIAGIETMTIVTQINARMTRGGRSCLSMPGFYSRRNNSQDVIRFMTDS